MDSRTIPEPMSGCFLWVGREDGRGYGKIVINGKRALAHRVAYEIANGPIPIGRKLDHLCRNHSCVNPRHLEPVTDRENTRRGVSPAGLNVLKTACPRGHPYSPANTYVDSKEKRYCRTCEKARKVVQWQRKKEALHAARG